MYVDVVPSSAVNTIDYLIFPEQHPNNQSYFYQNVTNYASELLNNAGKQFLNAGKQIFNAINDNNVIRLAKAAIRTAANIFHPNTIICLETLQELRMAQPIMQRFIMAEPNIREIYTNQKCDGYSDSYVDMHPKQFRNDHYDYRRVMEGMLTTYQDDNNEEQFMYTHYYEDLLSGDRNLTFDEKADILRTWDIINMFIKSGQDPTNIFGGSLGK